MTTFTNDTHGELLRAMPSSTQKQLLRDLNARYRDRLAPLNQALHSLTHLRQLEEQEYQRERMQIINGSSE